MSFVRQELEGYIFHISPDLLASFEAILRNLRALDVERIQSKLEKDYEVLLKMEFDPQDEQQNFWAKDRFLTVVEFRKLVNEEIKRRNFKNSAAEDLYEEIKDLLEETK